MVCLCLSSRRQPQVWRLQRQGAAWALEQQPPCLTLVEQVRQVLSQQLYVLAAQPNLQVKMRTSGGVGRAAQAVAAAAAGSPRGRPAAGRRVLMLTLRFLLQLAQEQPLQPNPPAERERGMLQEGRRLAPDSAAS